MLTDSAEGVRHMIAMSTAIINYSSDAAVADEIHRGRSPAPDGGHDVDRVFSRLQFRLPVDRRSSRVKFRGPLVGGGDPEHQPLLEIVRDDL
jgi:hypothetical protein